MVWIRCPLFGYLGPDTIKGREPRTEGAYMSRLCLVYTPKLPLDRPSMDSRSPPNSGLKARINIGPPGIQVCKLYRFWAQNHVSNTYRACSPETIS